MPNADADRDVVPGAALHQVQVIKQIPNWISK